jgi:hypothetical protein
MRESTSRNQAKGSRFTSSQEVTKLRSTAAVLPPFALGVYSGFTANSPDGGQGGMPGGGRPGTAPEFQRDGFRPGMPSAGFGRSGPTGPRSRQTDATRFLRGVQITDNRGLVAFTTLYPGWYSGRAIHIHMKVHVGGAAEKNYSGGHAWPTPVSSSSPKTSPNASPESSLIQSGSTCIAPLRQRMESLTRNTVPQGVLVAASTANSSWTSPMGSGSCACRHTACARARLERWARTLRRHC